MSELARIETVVFLQSSDLFSRCRAEEVLRVAALAQERRLAAGEAVYRANDAADFLYCVVRGGVRLEEGNGASRLAGPLQSFGVLEILSGRLRTATAIAETDTLALAIPAEDLFDLLAHNIDIVKVLFRHVIASLQSAAPSADPA